MKLTEGHELDRKSVARQQRPRPCCFNHLGQNDDHRREIGTRGHIDLWTGRREATERAPCCARDGEDHARPTKHEKAAGITRAAFLVSRSVALTTVVPSQWNHCSGWDASGPRARQWLHARMQSSRAFLSAFDPNMLSLVLMCLSCVMMTLNRGVAPIICAVMQAPFSGSMLARSQMIRSSVCSKRDHSDATRPTSVYTWWSGGSGVGVQTL